MFKIDFLYSNFINFFKFTYLLLKIFICIIIKKIKCLKSKQNKKNLGIIFKFEVVFTFLCRGGSRITRVFQKGKIVKHVIVIIIIRSV